MKKAGEGEGKFKLGGCTIDVEEDVHEKIREATERGEKEITFKIKGNTWHCKRDNLDFK